MRYDWFIYPCSSISRRQYKQLAHLLTQSRDEDCNLDTATSAEGENFRPIQEGNDQQNRQQQQVVSHCTSDDFTVTVYARDDQ